MKKSYSGLKDWAKQTKWEVGEPQELEGIRKEQGESTQITGLLNAGSLYHEGVNRSEYL